MEMAPLKMEALYGGMGSTDDGRFGHKWLITFKINPHLPLNTASITSLNWQWVYFMPEDQAQEPDFTTVVLMATLCEYAESFNKFIKQSYHAYEMVQSIVNYISADPTPKSIKTMIRIKGHASPVSVEILDANPHDMTVYELVKNKFCYNGVFTIKNRDVLAWWDMGENKWCYSPNAGENLAFFANPSVGEWCHACDEHEDNCLCPSFDVPSCCEDGSCMECREGTCKHCKELNCNCSCEQRQDWEKHYDGDGFKKETEYTKHDFPDIRPEDDEF